MRPVNHARLVSDHNQIVPKALLAGMGALVVTTLALVSLSVLAGRAPTAQVHTAVPVKSIMIELKDRGDGGTLVTDTQGRVLFDYPATERGFVSVVRNSLEFNRRKHDIAANPPVALIRFADGRIGLRDEATGWKINLIGFGQDNARHWNAVLDEAGK